VSGLATTLSFPPGHPVFAGHFPARPIVPGALLLDAALLAIGKARDSAAGGKEVAAEGKHSAAVVSAAPRNQVAAAKFFRPVGPGEILSLSLMSGDDGSVRFEWHVGTECVASGTVAPPESADSGHS
jgi:3-hydroxymyristoyl/3-hydroxydecanoyl-(acyl carrier protein) dehydratase